MKARNVRSAFGVDIAINTWPSYYSFVAFSPEFPNSVAASVMKVVLAGASHVELNEPRALVFNTDEVTANSKLKLLS